MTLPPDKTKAKGASPPKKLPPAAARQTSTVEKATEFSEQVLEHVATGQRNSLEAVREFMKSADRAVPSLGPRPTRRHAVIDSALAMSERLVWVANDSVRNVVHSTGETLGGANGGK